MRKLAGMAVALGLVFATPASANTVVAFGLDFHYELGLGFKQYAVKAPLPVVGLDTAAQLSGGGSGSAAITPAGDLLVTGGNDFGQAGSGHQWIPSTSFTKVASEVTSASMSGGNGILAHKNGTVEVWGGNGFGQLANGIHGDGTEASSIKLAAAAPIPVAGIVTATQVLAAGPTLYALLADGTVLGWGEGTKGQIGEPAIKYQTTPRPIAGLAGVVELAGTGAGKVETTLYARKGDGTVWTLGNGNLGQRGNGSTQTNGAPVQVKGLPPAQRIAGSRTNGMATAAGQLYVWGDGEDGALGYAGTEKCGKANPVACATTAHPVSGLTGVTSIDAGTQTTYAISNGSLFASGRDEWGQLGNGSTTGAARPQLILQGALKVSALDVGALVETNATTRAPTKLTATSTATTITLHIVGAKSGEVLTIGLQNCTGGPKERTTKSKTVARTTASTYTITGLLPRHEYEAAAGGRTLTRAVVRVKTLG